MATGSAWARGFDVALYPLALAGLADEGIERALRDGIERGYEGALPEAPAGCESFVVRRGATVVGVVAFVRGQPRDEAATVWAVAVVPEQRANAYGARALFAAERRLRREGVRELYSRVPRTNGRGLYFMLRCGYAPIVPPVEDGATWLQRNFKPVGRSAVGRARVRRGPPPQQPSVRGSSGGS